MVNKEAAASPCVDVEVNISRMSENITKIWERRPNYTPEEKTYLAELVAEYRRIIEDKRTGRKFNKKKREAWRVITVIYNDHCTTGHRETEDLKMLYDNMKQQARRNDGECFTNGQMVETVDIYKLRRLEPDRSEGQVEPLDNPYDRAAVYFRVPRHRTKKRVSVEAYKRCYFKKKCQNAILERKRIMQETLHAQQKHKLEMMILRKTLQKQS